MPDLEFAIVTVNSTKMYILVTILDKNKAKNVKSLNPLKRGLMWVKLLDPGQKPLLCLKPPTSII